MHPTGATGPQPARRERAWYHATIQQFLDSVPAQIVGNLATNTEYAVLQTQRDAWIAQIKFLQSALGGLNGSLLFEFSIPRMGKRIDAVLLIGPVVFVIEFKVGDTSFDRAAMDQVWDYALDLKNFHQASHHISVVPILVATGAAQSPPVSFCVDADQVFRPIAIQSSKFRELLDETLRKVTGEPIDAEAWYDAPYHPTPTIIEAARSLYANHSVEAIARFDAGAQNLRVTSRRIEELVAEAQETGQKFICFVTGVPGAGKTLVGLNLATRRDDADLPTHAVFLSGNGPLVAVLREALTRDEVSRRKTMGEKVRKGAVGEGVKAFIQNVHHFRDEALADSGPPIERVVIFDEAQRAWDLRQTANFMQRKKNQPGFSQSEPEFLISYMDRHSDWSVIVCLIGGGQEINTGEAGIAAWLSAVRSKFPHWHMYVSARLNESEYAADGALEVARQQPNVWLDDNLHLAVSMRSFRAENVSVFVKSLLDRDIGRARNTFAEIVNRYPIALTRDLNVAKRWLQSHSRGTERFGVCASSKAMRLKPHAVDVRVEVDPVHWFLNGRDDPRSSFYLEDAATEFQVQGLELDWTCVAWDADLRGTDDSWTFHDFRGSRWCRIANVDNQAYLKNAYRVLLTRARQGMIIFVPTGDRDDHTRLPEFYDSTFQYLAAIGIPLLPS